MRCDDVDVAVDLLYEESEDQNIKLRTSVPPEKLEKQPNFAKSLIFANFSLPKQP